MLHSKSRLVSQSRWVLRLALIASLPGIFLVFVLAWREGQNQTARAEKHLLASTQERARGEEQELALQRMALNSLSQSPALLSSDWHAFHDEAARLLGDPARRLWVFDLSGQLILASDQPNGPPATAINVPRQLIDSVVSASATTACGMTMDASSGAEKHDLVLSLCAPAPVNSKIAYILAIAVDPSYLANILDQPSVASAGSAMLVDQRGKIIARNDAKNAASGNGEKITPSFLATIATGSGGIISNRDTGTRTAYAPVGKTGWIVTAAINRAEAEPFPLGRTIVIGLAASLLVIVLIYALLRSKMRAILAITEAQGIPQPILKTVSEMEARYRLMAENTADVICVTSLDFIRQDMSPACRTMLGYEPEELIGRPATDIIHPDDALPRAELAAQLCDDTQPGIVRIIRLRHKDGRHIWVESRLRSFRSADTGEAIGFVSSMRDITARKEAEERAEEATRQAEAASRAKSDFLASMSHELRTPLNAILGFSQLLLSNQKMPLTERQREYIEYVIRGGNQLLTLINDLLDFVKTEAGTLRISIQNVELFDVLDEMVTTLEPLALQKKVTIALDEQKIKGHWVRADRTRLVQVLINLGSNAIKYNHADGRFVVIVERSRPGWIKISVKDTGRGIPDERRGEVFRPFNRLGAEGGPIEGTGIGLTISQRLMGMMGGVIDFSSTPGEGSVFWIELPESPSAETDAASLPGTQPVDPNPPNPRAVVDENSST